MSSQSSERGKRESLNLPSQLCRSFPILIFVSLAQQTNPTPTLYQDPFRETEGG